MTKLDSEGLPVLDKGKAVRTPFLRELEIGKNKEGYWNTALQGECSEEMAIIRNIKFPWVMHYEKQDASSGHHGYAKDALVATRLNRSHSGKQAFLRDTIVHINDLGPDHKLEAVIGSSTRFKQSFTFGSGELAGKQKGAEVVLLERGRLKPGMRLVHKTNKELCMQTVLSKCSDFAAEKPLLQQVLEKHGQMVHWLPKYHAPCNASEYFWGNGKKRFRQNCDYTMKYLKSHGMRTLFSIDKRTGWKFVRKARDFDRTLRDGATGLNMDSRVRAVAKSRIKSGKHASHIRPAPSQYEEE